MNYTVASLIACTALFFGMLLVSSAAYRFGRRRLQETGAASESAGAITGAVFALLGLLIAFTFSGAFARLDARRQLIVKEANAIGTAYLRLELLPAEARDPLKELFRRYVASRAALYEHLADSPAAQRELAKAAELQNEIWKRAVSASSRAEHPSVPMLLLPALNEMIDIVAVRTVAISTHTPVIIYVTLSIIALVCVGMTSYRAAAGERGPSLSYHAMLAAVTAFTLYIILDIEYPRHGIVRLDDVNRLLVELGETMKQ